ncbi:tail protein X [Campylobacter hyointestinalis]|uniref:tail protein X n=1 Tax=Campylobacter hyointestinalis TaxID=198 RepID=UPI0007254825|nr:tail protein X [Campylobacter hyointestinalis]PPB63083.1 phage tail protein [Campylobacter hyointestinalis subsp. hyointestinalis]PPB65353.1 phage tail protein [Campylobacter hyointestinalis subsp. hyointestinalis]CUU72382.1 tail protein X [Campylobacter hyointestinalis subsp. hyointestinalis]
MTYYIAKDGDQLDFICFKAYGTLDKEVYAEFLRENEQLLNRELKAGDRVNLPDINIKKDDEVAYLWQ